MERETYPYARPRTFEFLKAAIADGAHLELPYRVSEEDWVRHKNITATYFSCVITTRELGKMYGLSHQAIDLAIKKTIRRLWENSGAYTKARFAEKIERINPGLHEPAIGRSAMLTLRSLISGGYGDETVADQTGAGINFVRDVMRKMGRRELISTNMEKLKRAVGKLKSLPFEDFEGRQQAMNDITRGYYQTHRQQFASLREVAVLLDRKIPVGPKNSGDNLIQELKDNGIPVGIGESTIRPGKKARYIFIWKGDYLRLQQMRSVTNQGETRGPTS